ncbi:hypothetical protein GRI39_12460 [Altererythrobacter indicus]|uniref:Lipoprotein n=1 Tax=Altericroceibacterium indicum TaxID=374177 RepID=A0A845AAX4_9SPHN|nr:hypothetical protein [Altericroceibacterium indicum]MXP26844.1 hypothetical protein [Altericroceibacterium indicum]
MTLLATPLILAGCVSATQAQPAYSNAVSTDSGATYADLVDLADSAELVIRARIMDQITVKPERSPGLAPGHVRLYIEAQTEALLAGPSAQGASFVYLVDLPLTSKGKAPKLKKQSVILFADSVPDRPGELRLVAPDAQLPASPELEARLRPILEELASPDAPVKITGVREVMSIDGNLAGESETQMFLDTANDEPVSLSVVRRPGQPPRWGVSWSEIVDQSAQPPAHDTIAWYRLACSLPRQLPDTAFVQSGTAKRYRAEVDYSLILQDLGECTRKHDWAPKSRQK